ncbi:Nucleolar complex protein 3 like [Quillaja saponaria]|uniref:Nucleolar complex protein 3 like n=1 Tax=Quillaja saponaria TaxID=32244 RepID=A0AAD7QIJ7_QUISA|nr:Nucleolar complex protein 3 like [Quillaja saponaria]
MGKGKQKQKIVLPPELPPEITEEEIEVSDEDLQYVNENRDYAGFVSSFRHSFNHQVRFFIIKHVTRVADAKEDALEALYEKRLRKKNLEKEKQETSIQVDPVDALPVKTLDGKIYYRTLQKTSTVSQNGSNEEEITEDGKNGIADKSLVKLTKAEKRAKLKKLKKEAKKQGKDVTGTEVLETPQASVLAEVKEDLTAEEAFESKKHKLAELGNALLTDPESNIKFLKEMLQISRDNDHAIVKLGLLSLLAVFKDIIPGFQKLSKKTRYYESTLLSAYKAYLQKLIALAKHPSFQHVAVRCICNLLDANPHFNFRESLLGVVVSNISSTNDVTRKLCCSTIESLFVSEGKHGGEATVEAVRLIADHVKDHNCQLHPDSIEVFLSLSFDEDLRKSEKADEHNKVKNKRGKKRKNSEEANQLLENDRKRSKQELMTKMREEVAADYKAASFNPDVTEKRMMQSETLAAVFETYFRILKHTMEPTVARTEADTSSLSSSSGSHPLLTPCLKGLGKFSHLIDLDFMADLMNYLRKLASGITKPGNNSEKCLKSLAVTERLHCCIIAFKVMRNNLDALNVDLQDFFVQLYNLILEYRPGRDQGEVLAEALKMMLCEDRQHDMQKTAAFIKRLSTFSLCFGSAESMAALVTVRHLLQKNVKCRNMLENDAGGGSVSGYITKYQPYATDPNLSGALAAVLWELNLLSKHYHPALSTIASSISSMTTGHNQVYLSNLSPEKAFLNLSLEQESFYPESGIIKLHNKRKRGSGSSTSPYIEPTTCHKFS